MSLWPNQYPECACCACPAPTNLFLNVNNRPQSPADVVYGGGHTAAIVSEVDHAFHRLSGQWWRVALTFPANASDLADVQSGVQANAAPLEQAAAVVMHCSAIAENKYKL